MNEARAAGVVVDTMVISWPLFDDRPNPLADTYRELIGSSTRARLPDREGTPLRRAPRRVG